MQMLKHQGEQSFELGFVVVAELRVIALHHPLQDDGLFFRAPIFEMFRQLFVTSRNFEGEGKLLGRLLHDFFPIDLFPGLPFLFDRLFRFQLFFVVRFFLTSLL
jgi:hypothetical protein